jgi:hypothetical protein
VLFRGRFTCTYCGKKAPEVAMSIDHVVPDKGNGAGNLVVACFSCNSGKKAITAYAFCKARGLNFATVSRRISKQLQQPIGPFQQVAMEMSRRGNPLWLNDICSGVGTRKKAAEPDDESL